ncbi:maltose ABC transporter periplasmic protein [uncultured Clostridium sp.]|uniref:Sugar ABC transporter substrate-binding protein n=1 Tax=Muricoprocola aceti TaxID=2981772 RepID=A0ABT2SLR5_9FIRM|nr:sugar ABC transporter substrate-binding protein [Muricoprocola aceti]MCU6725449.1 sugar ABC transporter substrate-binding protein [Muricoprocola aceti]SCH51744.1 maltose ABC transporter periplasmic protein [uncultured Clostridium sp.]
MRRSNLVTRGIILSAIAAMALGAAVSADDTTLEFQQWWGVELPDGALQEICDGFTEETGVKIDLLSNPYADTKTQIAAGAAAGTMADVVGLDGSWVYDFAKQGSIANLTELMEADGYDDSQLSDQIKYEGNTYMIPVVNFAYPLFVNTDILEEAGVEEIPTTWSEFLDACDKITTNTDKAAYAIPLSTEAPNGIQNQFSSWLWASGGNLLQDGKPALTDNDKLAQLVDMVKTMKDKGYLSDGAEAMKEQDMVNEFENGRLAFMVDGISHLTTIKTESPDLNFTFAKMPVMDDYTDKSGMDVANWGIGIAENCENKEAAMQFVEYLMSPEVNAKLAQLANAFPGNSTAEPDYSSNDELFQKAFEIFGEGYAINEFTGAPTAEDLMRSMNEQLVLYIDGDTASVDEMLSATQEAWEAAYNQ